MVTVSWCLPAEMQGKRKRPSEPEAMDEPSRVSVAPGMSACVVSRTMPESGEPLVQAAEAGASSLKFGASAVCASAWTKARPAMTAVMRNFGMYSI